MLPEEVRATHFEEEVEQLDKRLSAQEKAAEVVGLLNLMHDLQDVGRSLAPRSAAPSKASRLSSQRFRGDPQRVHR
jgi:hypothetical protein